MNSCDLFAKIPQFEQAFLVALAKSVLIELPVFWIGLRKWVKISSDRVSSPKIIITGLLATGSTIPYLWFITPIFFRMNGLPLLALEAIIVLIEGIIYRLIFSCDWKFCLGISVFANALSWFIGNLLGHLG